jgi:hypothetical protein
MSATAKALSNVASYTRRFAESFATRKHRVLDDRDQSLADALHVLEERSDSYYPMITDLDATIVLLDSASPLTGLVITGANFVGDAVRASGISDEDDTVTTKELTWTRVVPGDEDITVTIVSSGVANNAVTCAWNPTTLALTVTRGTTATANDVFTAVNTDAVGKYIVDVTKTGLSATGVPTAGSITLTGGVGDLLTLTIGSTAVDGVLTDCGITAVTDAAITFDFDASNETTETMVLLQLRCDGVLVTPIPLIVDFPTVTVADLAVTSAKLAVGALSADATGRAVMATDYFNAATILLKIADGAFAADAATRLLFGDGIWTSAKLDANLIQYAEVTVSTAELKALRATPKTLVAGQAGKVIQYVGAVYFYDYLTNAYVIAAPGDDLQVKYTNGAGAAVAAVVPSTGFIDQASDQVYVGPAPTAQVLAKAAIEGQALVLHNEGGGEYTSATGGVLRVQIAYRVHTTGF